MLNSNEKKERTQRDPSSNGLPMIQRNTMETESATIQATTIHVLDLEKHCITRLQKSVGHRNISSRLCAYEPLRVGFEFSGCYCHGKEERPNIGSEYRVNYNDNCSTGVATFINNAGVANASSLGGHTSEPDVHNDPQYKLRMVADDSTIKTSWPSLIDTRNSSSMSMETWLLKFVRKFVWLRLLCYKKQMANLEEELKNIKERLDESENERNQMVDELRETKESANAGLSPKKCDQFVLIEHVSSEAKRSRDHLFQNYVVEVVDDDTEFLILASDGFWKAREMDKRREGKPIEARAA
ncbi:hypothetical protein Tco_0158057 [Tanacetum coccineum]